VVPKSVACAGVAGMAHVDLRGNNFIGAVPDCVWEAAHGNSHIYLSRNALSGTVGRLGAHVKHVHLNDNNLHGDLAAAASHVDGLRILDVRGNAKLTGSLGFLNGKHELRHLDVHGNAFTDEAEEPIAGILAGLPYLHSYDISRNNCGWNGTTATAEQLHDDDMQMSGGGGAGAKRRLAGGAADEAASTLGDDHDDASSSDEELISSSSSSSSSSSPRAYPSVAALLGAGAAAPTQVHVVLRISNPVAHFCPYCDGAVLEHNCGAISECHSRPDIEQFLTDDYVGKEHGPALREIAAGRPEVQAWAEKADSLDALQCTLKSLAAAGSRRSRRGSRGLGAAAPANASAPEDAEIKTELMRTYPYHGDTIASYTLHFPDAAAASEGASALAALAGHVGHELAPAAGCDAGARFGELLEVTARVECHTGFMGARCNYQCATRWERFENRMHTVNDQTSPDSRRKAAEAHAHREDVKRRRASSPDDRLEAAAESKRQYHDHVAHIGSSSTALATVPVSSSSSRQLLTTTSGGSSRARDAMSPAAADVDFDEEVAEERRRAHGSSNSNSNSNGKKNKKNVEEDAWLYGDGLIEYHHHVHVGDNHEADRHPRSVGTMSCSVGCRGYAHESLHLCKAWANNGRSKAAHHACKTALRETKHKCGVSFESDCHARGHDSYTPQRHITDEKHQCEVCGVYHHLQEYGVFTTGVSSTPRMYAKLADVIKPARRRSFSDQGPKQAPAPTAEHARRAASVARAVIDEASLGLARDGEAGGGVGAAHHDDGGHAAAAAMLGDNNFKQNLHLRAAAAAAAAGASDAVSGAGDEDLHGRGDLALTSDDAVKMQLPRCFPAMGCSMDCGSHLNDVMSSCVDWLDQAPTDAAQSATGAPRDLCISALRRARGSCAEAGELQSCYHPTADGFVRILMGPNKNSPDAMDLGKDNVFHNGVEHDGERERDVDEETKKKNNNSNKAKMNRRALKDAA
jgi:hypothetical protein